MADTEWIEIGRVIGDTGPKGDTGDIGIGTVIKGHYNTYDELIQVHPSGSLGDAYIVNGSYYYWDGTGWANAGSIKGDKGDTGDKGVKGDTGAKGSKGDKGETGPAGPQGEPGPKGDTGDTGPSGDTGPAGPTGDTGATGTGLTIKGSYDSYEELINDHPTGNDGDSYLVNGSLYVWNGSSWENVGNIKGEKGDTGETGAKGDTGSKGETGANGFSPTVNVNHEAGKIIITSQEGSVTISFDELKGDTGAQGVKGDTGAKGDTGSKGDTGVGSDEEAGWKLPVDKIQTTTTLPTGVSEGYRVAICTSSVMAIKEYNGSSWDSESLNPYSVIPLKHSGGIQMYLAKVTGPVYMGVEYGVFGKFRFMTQSAYDNLSSYDEDTIYFVRS
ncbi:hypothetical protein [Methanobrevibacter sp. UBA212]|uniref:phage upper tail fiber protein n=1 Tax=Methanobrevibacter sp. UBA212 TaxID=1915476 RepID=UPI0025D9250E|nr:hypothetical protein [Methanobrevibacter sp. UBA212]